MVGGDGTREWWRYKEVSPPAAPPWGAPHPLAHACAHPLAHACAHAHARASLPPRAAPSSRILSPAPPPLPVARISRGPRVSTRPQAVGPDATPAALPALRALRRQRRERAAPRQPRDSAKPEGGKERDRQRADSHQEGRGRGASEGRDRGRYNRERERVAGQVRSKVALPRGPRQEGAAECSGRVIRDAYRWDRLR